MIFNKILDGSTSDKVLKNISCSATSFYFILNDHTVNFELLSKSPGTNFLQKNNIIFFHPFPVVGYTYVIDSYQFVFNL